MIILKPESIYAAFPGARKEDIDIRLPKVLNALEANLLTTPRAIAYALATIAVECAGFVPLTEYVSHYNTDPEGPSYGRYEGRVDLGNVHSGDGAKYCGRGFIQLTGRANYEKYGERISVDLIQYPVLAINTQVAADILALFIADRWQKIDAALQKTISLPRARPSMVVRMGWIGLRQPTK